MNRNRSSFAKMLTGWARKTLPIGSPRQANFQPGVEALGDRVVPAAISGHVYQDVTGNGQSADDTAVQGVAVKLYKDSNNNGVYDSGTDAYVTSATSGSTGAYSFGGLGAARYFVTESVPANNILTAPTPTPYRTVNLGSTSVTGQDFDNFQLLNTAAVGGVSFTVIHPDGTQATVTDLRGNTHQNDTVVAHFTVAANTTTRVTLVTYNAPGPNFDASQAYLQTIVSQVGGVYTTGSQPRTYSLTVKIPNNYYQIDFVVGYAIDHFGPPGGNVFYGTQDRLCSADNGGTQSPQTGSISGKAFLDLNQDGTLTAGQGDGVLPGVKLNLLSGGAVVDSTTTDGNGNYSFTGLGAGTYTVSEAQPASWKDGYDYAAGSRIANSNTTDTIGVTLAGGGTSANNNFTEKGGSIAGNVFLDVNQDGTLTAGQGDKVLAGVTLNLYDAPGNLVGTTSTDAGGNYTFAGLAAGAYAVREVQPSAYADGFDYAAGSRIGGSDKADAIGVSLAAGQASANNAFTEKGGTVSGRVFLDVNQDGTLTATDGDKVLSGVTVKLYQGGTLIGTTTTDAGGGYSFGGLAAGSYTIKETQPAAYADGLDYANGIVVPASDQSDSVLATLAAGATADATFTEKGGSISGNVFLDTDQDGVLTALDGDKVLSGVAVNLYDAGDNLVASASTDAAGNYSFGGLAAGAYTVREGQPSAYGDGFDYAAGVFIPGSDKTDAIGATLAAGATVGTAFTEKPGSLAGDVFVDPNHNGRLDAGEAGIAGVTLTLTDAEGDTRVATTDSNGHYAFPNLVNGTYAIAETQPAGYGDDADYAGTLGGAVGDDAISAVRITNGQNGTSYNFTETVPTAEAGPTGSISGHVYLDVNQDGRFDETQGDRYLDGVTVDLLRADASGNPLIAPDGTFDVITSTVTKDGGYYSFGGLAAGYYALYEHQPTAYLDGAEQIPGADGTFPSDANPVTPNGTEDPCLTDDAAVSKDVVFQVALPAGGQLVDYDFTEQGGSLAGAVAMPGERGLTAPQDADGDPVHAVIDLYYSADAGRTYTLLKTAQTGDDGTFTFAGLAAGTYKLVEHTPAGFVTGGEYGGVVTHAADNSMESEGTPADDPALPALTDIVLDAGDRGQGFGFLNKPSF